MMINLKVTLCFIFLCFNLINCKKEEIIQNPPSVLTKEASEIQLAAPNSNVTLNGEVSEEGFAAVTERGFVYSDKNTIPSVSDIKVNSGFGKGLYSIKLTGLALNTKYYYRAYATSSKATSYGNVQTFITADYKLATVVTKSASLLNNTVIDFIGEVTDEGGGTTNEWGFVVGKKSSPTFSNSTRIVTFRGINYGNNKGSRTQINGDANSKYFIRSYAINEKGVSYGNELNITTSNKVETVVNTIISPVTGRVWMDRNLGASRAAISKGDILAQGLAQGDLYQWGRKSDGHQISVSETTSSLSNSDIPQNGLFITTSTFESDWRTSPNNNLWQGVNGINNVCPTGFRIPTLNEFKAERDAVANLSNGELGPLKMIMTLKRTNENLIYKDTSITYWTSSVSTLNSNYVSIFTTSSNGSSPQYNFMFPKTYGIAVRCIKN